MRVISGSARGRKLLAPSGLDTRPTTDRVKESMFNIISPYIPANNVLDLFAGSGALGIEALSRGSGRCTFVETHREALSVLKKNIEASRLLDCSVIIPSDAFSYLKKSADRFDVIILDPPYNTGFLNKAIDLIYENDLLCENGIILAESEFLGEEPENIHFDIIKRVKYGKTQVFVLCRN